MAKIIDFLASKLTPKTFYWPSENPFNKLEHEGNKPYGFFAAMHLISMATKTNAQKLTVNVEGFSDSSIEFGDWIVIVTRKEPV